MTTDQVNTLTLSLESRKVVNEDEFVMNRDFIYHHQRDRQSGWSRTANTLNRWLWGALCCGVPGIPCYFCNCCERLEDVSTDRERPRVNHLSSSAESTATVERIARPHRPHAPRGRKHTPETLSAVRCALSQLQGEPAPPLPSECQRKTPEPELDHIRTPSLPS